MHCGLPPLTAARARIAARAEATEVWRRRAKPKAKEGEGSANMARGVARLWD